MLAINTGILREQAKIKTNFQYKDGEGKSRERNWLSILGSRDKKLTDIGREHIEIKTDYQY